MVWKRWAPKELQITTPPGTLPALLKKCTPEIRNSNAARQPLFQITAGADADLAPQTQHMCPVLNCGIILADANHAVNHTSYHRLHTPSLLRDTETCALCLGPASACPAFLLKTSSLQPRHFYTIFSPGAAISDAASGVKFISAGMSKSTTTMPSTNIPIVCPVCEPALADAEHKLTSQVSDKKSTKKLPAMRPAVMKYNFRAHWARLHGSTVIPAGLSQAIELAPNEKKLLSANRGGKVSATQMKSLTLV